MTTIIIIAILIFSYFIINRVEKYLLKDENKDV
jgi:hypothetical protein